MNKIIYVIIAFAAIMAGCNNKATKTDSQESAQTASTQGHDHASHGETSHQGHDHEAEQGHNHQAEVTPSDKVAEGEHADEIIFPVAQAKRTDFKVEQINPQSMNNVIRCSGQILAAQGDEVTVAAPVAGIVTFAGVKLTDGVSVGKGAKLFYISSKNIASGDVAAKSEASYQKAKADYLRAQKLVDEKIVSQKEFDQIEMTYRQAKAEYEALASAQSARGTSVSTPISGYITSLGVSDGQYVEMGQVLANVSQNRRLVLRAEVSQRYYNQLKSVQTASFSAPYQPNIYVLSQMNGRLLSVGKSSGTGSTLIPVSFEFDNHDGVVQGSYVDVFLQGATMGEVLSVPLTAVTEQQGIYYIYIQLDEEGYQRREVTLGANNGERVQIVSGLNAGERVVTRGAINVKMASASGAIPHGHQH